MDIRRRLFEAGLMLANRLLGALMPNVSLSASGFQTHNTYQIWHYGPNGELKGHAEGTNITVNVGLNDILTQYFKGASYTAAFFVGLKGPGTAVAADTMVSHASWSELSSYSQSTRPALTLGAVSGQAVDNSASKATFTITGPLTVSGAFITTNSTISGTTGTLVGAADFQATGTVNTSGTAVTSASGTQFSAAWNGQSITINGSPFTISSVTDATHLVLTSSAGTQSGVAYSTVNTKLPGNGDTLAIQINLSAASA